MDRSPNSRAAHLLERAGSEPEFEAALRAAYAGRHNVLDALWWAAHPRTTSPRGVADPASALRDLQRAAFSRSATGSPVELQQAEHRLREAERVLSDDARELADAIEAVEPDTPVVADTQPVDDPPPVGDLERPRRKYVLPLVSVAAVLAAIVVFPALSGLNADADADPVPTSTSRAAERVKTEIVTLGSDGNVGDPLAILERPQTPEDRPAGDLRLSPESYRALPDLVQHAGLYLARGNQPGSICLVVIRENELSMSTCQPESEFAEQMLRLGGGRYEVAPQLIILTESYALLPSGDFRYEATARMTGLAPPSVGAVVEPD